MIELPQQLIDIIHQARAPSVPFSLSIEPGELECTQVLRYLPGKRLACRARYNDQAVVAKFFFSPTAKRHFQKEVKATEKLLQADVLTPKIIFAKALTAGCYCILYPYLDSAFNLSEVWTNPIETHNLKLVWKNLVKIFANLHQMGLHQNDIHANNFLMAKNGLYLLDAGEVKSQAKPLNLKQSADNLADLLIQFPISQQSKCLNYFSDYSSLRKLNNSKLLKKVNAKLIEKRWQRFLKYKNKFYRNSTEFIRFKNNHHLVIGRRHSEALLKDISNNPNLFFNEKAEYLKKGNTCTVIKILFENKHYIIKRYNIKSFFHSLKRAFQKSRARKSWENSNYLELMKILTPMPIAMIEERRFCFARRSYFICEYVEGDLGNEAYEKALDKNKIIQPLEKVLENLAKANVVHGDLKATNFILKDNQAYIFDLDSMKIIHDPKALKQGLVKDRNRFLRNFA